MSEKASTIKIGAFVVGAVVLVVAAVVVFGSGKFFKVTSQYVLFFEGSVNGLSVGSPVAFRGVRLGSVTDIKIFLDGRDLSLKIPVFIEIDTTRITEVNVEQVREDISEGLIMDILVERGLRAQLELQSLVTGQLYVNLDFYPDKPARLVNIETDYRELPTIPSPFEALAKTIQTLPLDQLANKFLSAIEGIEAFVNSPELKETVKSLEAAVKDAQTLLRNLGDQVQPVSEDIEKTLYEAQKLLQNINNRVGPLAASIDATIKDTRGIVRNIDKKIDPLLITIEDTFKATRAALTQVNETLSTIQGATGEGSALRYQVIKTMEELSAAARSVRVLTDYLERHPEALIRGKVK